MLIMGWNHRAWLWYFPCILLVSWQSCRWEHSHKIRQWMCSHWLYQDGMCQHCMNPCQSSSHWSCLHLLHQLGHNRTAVLHHYHFGIDHKQGSRPTYIQDGSKQMNHSPCWCPPEHNRGSRDLSWNVLRIFYRGILFHVLIWMYSPHGNDIDQPDWNVHSSCPEYLPHSRLPMNHQFVIDGWKLLHQNPQNLQFPCQILSMMNFLLDSMVKQCIAIYCLCKIRCACSRTFHKEDL